MSSSFVLVLLFLNWFAKHSSSQALCGSTKSPFVDVHLHLPALEERFRQVQLLKMSRETFTLLKSNSANNILSRSSSDKNNKRPSVRTRPSTGSVKARNENRPSTSHIVRKNSSRNKGRKSKKGTQSNCLVTKATKNKKGQRKARPLD